MARGSKSKQCSLVRRVLPSWEALETAATPDLYVQPIRSTATGVGVMGSKVLLMPYGQLRLLEAAGGQEIYTTQAVSRVAENSGDGYYWFPSVALRDARTDGSRGVVIQLSGGVPIEVDGGGWAAALGVIVDFQLGAAR